jgi:pSer/pThr/pTyr-binding forkhead associated (FHA) protein
MTTNPQLGLYQVFLKLWEYHCTLLDEIIQFEKINSKKLSNAPTRYITGIIQAGQVYLVTNLADGKTKTLFQPQGIWTIGRDRQLAISIAHRQLSRHHAVIQYVPGQGFYLVDLNSTNGSFVNGEPVHGRMLLKDGDRVRLSSIAFSFFLGNQAQILKETPPDILAKLNTFTPTSTSINSQPLAPSESDLGSKIPPLQSVENISSLLPEPFNLEDLGLKCSIPQLSAAQQSEILNSFFRRQIQKVIERN